MMMNKTWCAGLLGLALVGSVSAEGIANAVQVSAVRTDASGKGYVVFATALTGTPPKCGADYPRMLAFDVNTPGGRGIQAIALAAKASGRTIYARGSGDCTVYSVVESWNWGELR